MSKEDIDKAVKEAEQFAAEDKKRREAVDAKNEAENIVYQAEKLVSESGDKIPEADKTQSTQRLQLLKRLSQRTMPHSSAQLRKTSRRLLTMLPLSFISRLLRRAVLPI